MWNEIENWIELNASHARSDNVWPQASLGHVRGEDEAWQGLCAAGGGPLQQAGLPGGPQEEVRVAQAHHRQGEHAKHVQRVLGVDARRLRGSE